MKLEVTVRVSQSGYILCDYWPKVIRMTIGRAYDIRQAELEAPIFTRLKKQHNTRKGLEIHG